MILRLAGRWRRSVLFTVSRSTLPPPNSPHPLKLDFWLEALKFFQQKSLHNRESVEVDGISHGAASLKRIQYRRNHSYCTFSDQAGGTSPSFVIFTHSETVLFHILCSGSFFVPCCAVRERIVLEKITSVWDGLDFGWWEVFYFGPAGFAV